VVAARSRGAGSGATSAREPSQVRKEAALSGSAWVPPGRLALAASGPFLFVALSTGRDTSPASRSGLRRVRSQTLAHRVFLCRPGYRPGYPAGLTLGTPASSFATLAHRLR